MFRIIVILAAFGYCSSNPPTILDYVNHIEPYDYTFSYLTSDGIGQEDLRELKSTGTPEDNYVAQGRTSWRSPERIPFLVTSVSDNNSPDTFQSYISSIFFVGPPEIGLLNNPAFNPSTPLTLQQHSIYSTTSLHPTHLTVNPSTHLRPQQHSIYSTTSLHPSHPTVNPSTHLGPQQNSIYSTSSLHPSHPTVNPLTHLEPQQHFIYSTASLHPSHPTINPSTHLRPQQHSIESLKLKHPSVNPVLFFQPKKYSIYSIEHLQSERPTVNPSILLEPQQYSIDSLQPELNSSRPTAKPTTSRPSIRPVQTYVPPTKSTTFGPEEDTLPANRQPSTGNITDQGVTPAGPPRVQDSTMSALLGIG